jgi:hypothetical protein
MAHYISYNLFDGTLLLDNRGNSRANTYVKTQLYEGLYLLDKKPMLGNQLLGDS